MERPLISIAYNGLTLRRPPCDVPSSDEIGPLGNHADAVPVRRRLRWRRGGKSANREKTVRVTGVVTYQNKPVEGATVTFNPGTGSTARAAFGVTDSNGKYSLTTYESNDGAIPGKYFVTVAKKVGPERPADPAREEDYVPPEDMPKQPVAAPVSVLPAKYAAPTTSGLTADVTDKSGQTFDFPLAD